MHSTRRAAAAAATGNVLYSLTARPRASRTNAQSAGWKIATAVTAAAGGLHSAQADVSAPTASFSHPAPMPTVASTATQSHEADQKFAYNASFSPYATLFTSVANLHAPSIQTLSRLVDDTTNHASLLEGGVVDCLSYALDACTEDAIRVNLIKLLADLSARDVAHKPFLEKSVMHAVENAVFHAIPVEGWYDWAWRQVGFPRASTHASADGMASGVAYHLTRLLSHLCRNPATHTAILSTRIPQHLCLSLQSATTAPLTDGDHLHADTLRAEILAVSALCKTAPQTIVREGAHRRLIYFASCDDETAQSYAMGGIRNLARDSTSGWRVHRELVVSGVVDALVKGLDKGNVQTKVFSALAMGDIMCTGHAKKHLIHERLHRAYQPYAKMLNDKNPIVSRAVSRAVCKMYETGMPESFSRCVGEEVGAVVNGGVMRGDLLALRAAHAMCRDDIVVQSMVDKGLLEVLVTAAQRASGEFWGLSTAALSSLAARKDFIPLIVSRGALKTVMKRPCLENDGVHAATFLANCARDADHLAEVAHGGLKVLLYAAASKDENARREGVRGLYNLSLGGVSRVMIGQGGALAPLVKAASASGDVRRYAIGALAEIAESFEQATKMIEADVLRTLLESVREDPTLSREVGRCVGYLSQVTDVHGSLATSGVIDWLAEMISRNGGRGSDSADVMHYCTVAVCNIAYSPGVARQKLKESGIGGVLTVLCSSGMSAPVVLHAARQGLANLRGEKAALVPVEVGKASVPA